MRSTFRPVFVATAMLALFLLSGCGGNVVQTGKVTNGGQPLTVSDKGVIQIAFASESEKGQVYPALVKPDGSFTVPGPDGHGISPGKYRITVVQMDPYPGTDKLGGKFATGKSQLVREVGSGYIDVDISKP